MDTVNQDNQPTAGSNQQERTFTQSEMNAIIADRIKRESAKYSDYEDIKAKAAKYDEGVEAEKSELQKATERAEALQTELTALKNANSVREIREKVASSTGVPASLLTGDTEEACKTQADAILAFAKPGAYPNVRDEGEAQSPNLKKNAQDQFADWFKAAVGN